MNKENHNNTIFYSGSHIKMVQEIQSFYKNYNIELEFKSITSYLNFKSYTFSINESVKLSSIRELVIDLASYLKVKPIRVISRCNNISFEIYNKRRRNYDFLKAMEDEKFQSPQEMQLPVLLGERNGAFVIDLAKMPNLLIGGSIGSGKSVFINSLILSLLYHHSPETLKLVLIDPKVVELSIYNDIPHLLMPVVIEKKHICSALNWCVEEVERRYKLLSKATARNITQYNDKVGTDEKLPNIVVVIDEFADIMLSEYKSQFQDLIYRLCQKARAAGIYLIMATQRPVPDIISSVIQSNIISRIAFTVSDKLGSRTILDCEGAECLTGRGDFLFHGYHTDEPIRIQAPFLSSEEIYRITEGLRKQGKPNYMDLSEYLPLEKKIIADNELDPLFDEAIKFVRTTNLLTISAMQRHFGIGFNRAAVIIEQLEQKGIVSPPLENGKRTLL